MFDDLKDKVVVVTGGVTGIGGAASLAFHEAGARVLAQYLGGGKELDDFIKKGISTIKLDLTERGAPERLIGEAVARFGAVDVLINNAGGMVQRCNLDSFTDELFDKVMDLNVRQLLLCCQAALPVFRRQGRGNIINVTSIAAKFGGSAGSSVYAGSKGFVSAFSKSIAKELVGENIRVNCVSPGTIHTAFHDRHSDEAKREAARKTIPMGRLGEAEDCAGTFLYLASERASGYLTGQVIEVNGGQLMA
jgi:3-oxoacyl-[acyl-carrier protein] reductase